MVEKKIGVYDAKSDAKLPGNVLDSLNNALGTELLEKLEALGAEASGVKKVEDAIDKTVKNIAEETTTNPENYQGRAVAPKTGLLTTEDDEKEEENDEEEESEETKEAGKQAKQPATRQDATPTNSPTPPIDEALDQFGTEPDNNQEPTGAEPTNNEIPPTPLGDQSQSKHVTKPDYADQRAAYIAKKNAESKTPTTDTITPTEETVATRPPKDLLPEGIPVEETSSTTQPVKETGEETPPPEEPTRTEATLNQQPEPEDNTPDRSGAMQLFNRLRFRKEIKVIDAKIDSLQKDLKKTNEELKKIEKKINPLEAKRKKTSLTVKTLSTTIVVLLIISALSAITIVLFILGVSGILIGAAIWVHRMKKVAKKLEQDFKKELNPLVEQKEKILKDKDQQDKDMKSLHMQRRQYLNRNFMDIRA